MSSVYGGLLAPPEDVPGADGLPDCLPDWLLSDPGVAGDLLMSLTCDCCGRSWAVHERDDAGGDKSPVAAGAVALESSVVAEAEVGWAIPGVTGMPGSSELVLPVPSPEVQAVLDAIARLESVEVTGVPGAQALVDAQALLEAERRLRVLDLRRIGDVQARGLAVEGGYASTTSWLRQHRPDGDVGDARLAGALRDHPVLEAAVRDGSCSLGAARKVNGGTAAVRDAARPAGRADRRPAG